ncbi:MAG: hypothetical protein KJO07_11860 [Deltaproteobacteria bacterium]|jgi:hypothetical protein|nr:hypothetical protein [Deltaproteobacteria bacterium]
MGGKPRKLDQSNHSQITRRTTDAPKRAFAPSRALDQDAIPVSIHDAPTRDYAIDPPSE